MCDCDYQSRISFERIKTTPLLHKNDGNKHWAVQGDAQISQARLRESSGDGVRLNVEWSYCKNRGNQVRRCECSLKHAES